MLSFKTLIAGVAGLAILTTGGVLVATAAFDGNAVTGQSQVFEDATIDQSYPAPVVAQALFVNATDSDGNSCMSQAAVVSRLKVDMTKSGGEIYVLQGGLQQSFADEWRHEAHVGSTKVSSVVAHAFPDSTGGQYTVDVVEFDPSGCAMSRTMLSGEDWNGILKSVAGAEV